ncbi:hypothetical protein [Sporofaciens sp. SGI.106]|uniref:hypothetical protein n=1 Tax=Sporofaciens sp. SGI.106 TaxID=3420568 RepID=UPI003CFC8C2C
MVYHADETSANQEYQMVLLSDQGSVYTSKAFNDLLPMYVTKSMSRAGTPTDNSAMESINGWIKAELFLNFHVTGEQPIHEKVDKYIKIFNEECPTDDKSNLFMSSYRQRKLCSVSWSDVKGVVRLV